MGKLSCARYLAGGLPVTEGTAAQHARFRLASGLPRGLRALAGAQLPRRQSDPTGGVLRGRLPHGGDQRRLDARPGMCRAGLDL